MKPRYLFIAAGGLTLSTLLFGQRTVLIKKTDIIDPKNSEEVLGRLHPGTEVVKIGKDASGKFVKATLEFYVPLEALKEGRVAKRMGEWQVADKATIKLSEAKKQANTVTVSVIIVNHSQNDMDISALLLFKLVDQEGNVGNLEFMRSRNSIGTIPPGETLQSDLVYTFHDPPENLEMTFQSKLGGDQVFFVLDF